MVASASTVGYLLTRRYGLLERAWAQAPIRTIEVAQDTAFGVLDPAPAGVLRSEPEINRHLYSGLVKFDSKMNVVPDLATSWTASGDRRTWTFRLRSGVKFHDGTDFSAEAVKFSFDRLLDPQKAFQNRGVYAPVIAELKVIDPTTVQIVTKNPTGVLPNYLAHISGGIVSPAAVQKFGDDFALHPVGTGPFMAKEIVSRRFAVVRRNPNYFGQQPRVDEIAFRAIVEEGARVAAIEAGQVDIATGLPAQHIQRLKRAGISIATAPSLQAQFLAFNVTRPDVRDVRVRQAINYAIDKRSIIRTLFLNTFEPLDSILAPGYFGYQKQTPYEYNPSKAKELLAASGYDSKNPLRKLTLWTPEDQYPKDVLVAQAIQGQLKRAGIDVEIQKHEVGSYYTNLKNQTNFDLFMFAFIHSTADGYLFFEFVLKGDSGDTPTNFRFTRYKNPRFDALVDQAGAVGDEVRRRDLLQDADRMIWEDAPFIALYAISIVNGYRKGISGVETLPLRFMDLTNATKT